MASFLRNSILVVFLLGCYSPRKAERQLDKAAKYPAKVAAKCHQMFPVVTKSDTVQNTEYDFIEIEGQDRYITIDKIKTDTLIKYVTRKVQLPGKVITITNVVKDSAEVYQLGVALQNCQNEAKAAEGKAAIYLKIAKMLGAILALLILAILSMKEKKKANA